MRFHIETMACGGCVRGATQAIRSVDPAARVGADPATRQVEVVSDQPRARLEAALVEAEFPTSAGPPPRGRPQTPNWKDEAS